jgi:hypothetical protein
MSYELIINNVKVTLADIGEGIYGEYAENDPDDRPLLRFDVYKRCESPEDIYDEWEPLDDASYCTNIHADTPWHEIMHCLANIMNEVYFYVENDYSVKKVCEKLSWMG